MQELFVVNREMVIPLHRLFRLEFACLCVPLGLWPMYRLILELYFEYFRSLVLFCKWHRGVP